MSNSSVVTASISVPAVSAISGVAAGSQTQTSGTAVFTNSNGVTFGMSNSSVITASIDAIRSISAGGSSGSFTGITLSNSNNVSFGLSAGTITASASFPADILFGLAAGTQTVTTGTVIFSNSNGLTFGFSNSTLTASYTQSTNLAAAAAGTQTQTSGTVVFSNSNNITFGMSNSSVITASFSAPAVSAISGIAAGTQTATSGTVLFSNSNGFTFGMSNSSVITATYERRITAFSQWADFATNFNISHGTLSIQKVSMPMHLSATRAMLLLAMAGKKQSSGALTISMGVYTMSGSTASLASTASRQISWTSGAATTATSIYGGVSGTRYRSLGVNYSMTPGDYLFAYHFQTTNDGAWSAFGRPGASIVGTYDGAETDYFIDGTSVSSFTTAFPASIVATNTNYARTGDNALQQPGVILVGTV